MLQLPSATVCFNGPAECRCGRGRCAEWQPRRGTGSFRLLPMDFGEQLSSIDSDRCRLVRRGRVRGGAVAVFMIHGNLLGIIKLSTFARAALRQVISIS